MLQIQCSTIVLNPNKNQISKLFFILFYKKLRMPNTDNMGKLFVTLFAFVPALKTNL